MKTIKRESTVHGQLSTDWYSKNKVRQTPGKIVKKSVNTRVVTDLDKQKTYASGEKTKTVTKNGMITKTKTKPLSPRRALMK